MGHLAACAVLGLAVGCGGSQSPASPTPSNPAPSPATSLVEIVGVPAVFYRGQVSQLTAYFSSGILTLDVTSLATWRSSNTGVAAVSANGLLTGIGIGTADITATFEGSTGTVTVQVRDAPSATRPDI